MSETSNISARQYLKQLQKFYNNIEQNQEELQQLRASTISIGSVDISKERVDGGKISTNAPFANIIIKAEELEEEINTMRKKYDAHRQTLIKQINNLTDNRYINILYKRYIEFKTLSQTAKEMNYAYRHIKRLHNKALLDFSMKNVNMSPLIV